MIELKLKSCCVDCPHAYITVSPEIFYQQHRNIPLIGTTTIFCKHMDVCTHFIDCNYEENLRFCTADGFIVSEPLRNASESSQEGL